MRELSVGFSTEPRRQNVSGIASADWYTRFCRAHKLSGYRACSTRAKHRTAGEREANLVAFFKGTNLRVDGTEGVKTFAVPGYLAAMDLVWSTAGGVARKYRDSPERVANLDESYMAEQERATACAPTGARHVNCAGGGQPQSVTVLSGATLTGVPLPDVFLWEGTCASTNALKYAPANCGAITRPDGYMMTAQGWIKVLEKLRGDIPGARKYAGFGLRSAARVTRTHAPQAA